MTVFLAAGQTTTDADIVRRLAGPDVQTALTAAAAALEERPQLLARIADLENPNRHLVRPGDTLWSLARTYGTTVTQLRAWNELAGDVIVVGSTLRIR